LALAIWFAGIEDVPAVTACEASLSLLIEINGAGTEAGMAWSETRGAVEKTIIQATKVAPPPTTPN